MHKLRLTYSMIPWFGGLILALGIGGIGFMGRSAGGIETEADVPNVPSTSSVASTPASDSPAFVQDVDSPGARAMALQPCPFAPILQTAQDSRHSFYFTRGAYSSSPRALGGYRPSAWATDFNKADRQLLVVLRRVLPLDAFACENPVRLDDPDLRRFPFLYVVEVGYMGLTPPEVEGLRSYLLSGGFLLVDDFWGTVEWANFEREMRQVLPDHTITEIPMDHLVFRIVYPVREILQVPSINNARRGVYHERDGHVPHIRGIFDDEGRLMVAIAWNSDLGDAWEWAEQPDYPWDRSNFALQMGINFIVYAMTH